MLLLLFEKKFTPGCKNWHPSTKSAWARQNHDKPRDCFNRSSLSTIWSSSSNGQKECVSRVTIYLSSKYYGGYSIGIINPQSQLLGLERITGGSKFGICCLTFDVCLIFQGLKFGLLGVRSITTYYSVHLWLHSLALVHTSDVPVLQFSVFGRSRSWPFRSSGGPVFFASVFGLFFGLFATFLNHELVIFSLLFQ